MGTGSGSWASDVFRRAVEAASGRPPIDAYPPRHRAPIDTVVPPTGDDRIFFTPDPGRYPRRPIGFRSTQDVVSEMPVIYRPGGGGRKDRPEREPEPPRVPIAPPHVPTASTYADDPAPARATGFDEDPDIADDELDAAADDAILDSLEAVEPRTEPRRPDVDGPLDASGLGDDLPTPLAPEPEAPAAEEPAPVETPAGPPRYSVPKPRYSARPSQPVAPEPEPVDELPPPPPLPPVRPPAPEPVFEPEPPVVPEPVADLEPAPEPAPVAPPRPRVRTLHISAPPTGPGDDFDREPAAPVPPLPVDETPVESVEAPVDLPIEPPIDEVLDDEIDPRWRDTAPRPIHRPDLLPPIVVDATPADDAVEDDLALGDEPAADVEITEQVVEPATAERSGPGITGRVASSRGRGLSGITVTLVEGDDLVVTSVGTGRHGEYAFTDVAPGSYRVTVADDIDGDFAASWYGSSRAESVEITDPETGLRGVDVAMRSAVTIDASVDVRKRKAIVTVDVVENATGLPATGSVRVTTELFSAELPLVDGRTAVTLIGSAREWGAGVPRLAKRVRLDYRGSTHGAPATRSIKLR